MFGANEIVGRKYFKEQKEDCLTITSMFYTIQGEGPYSGRPAYFVRLAKCNLACSFCDTYFDSGNSMTFQEILDRIDLDISNWYLKRKHNRPKTGLIVLTGGEPALQSNYREFIDFVEKYSKNQTFEFQIESNGILPIESHHNLTVVCSPKCLEKDNQPEKYIKPHLTTLKNAHVLKFVIHSNANFEDGRPNPYHTVPEWALTWKKQDDNRLIYVSPMNVYLKAPKKGKNDIDSRSTIDETISFWEEGLLDREINRKNHEHTALVAMEKDLILSLQTHLFASLP